MTHRVKDESASDEPRALPLQGAEAARDDDSLCLELPLGFEDPEGWMSERRGYWLWTGEVDASTPASWPWPPCPHRTAGRKKEARELKANPSPSTAATARHEG